MCHSEYPDVLTTRCSTEVWQQFHFMQVQVHIWCTVGWLRSSWAVFVLLFVSERPLFRSIHVFLMINRQLSFIKLENENILDSASHIQWRDHSPIIWPYNELCWIVTCKRYHLISPCVRKLVVRIYCRRSIQYADSSSHVSALLTFFISKPRVLDWNFLPPILF